MESASAPFTGDAGRLGIYSDCTSDHLTNSRSRAGDTASCALARRTTGSGRRTGSYTGRDSSTGTSGGIRPDLANRNSKQDHP